MSAVPDTYSSPAVQGAQPSQRVDLNHQTFGNCGESGMPDQSEENVPLKGRGLGLLISCIFTTVLAAVTLVGDFMTYYTDRQVLEPMFIVGLAVVTILFFLERRKKLATSKILYVSIGLLSIAVVLLLVQIWSLIEIVFDISFGCKSIIWIDVYLIAIALIAAGCCFIIGFGAAFQCSITKDSPRKSERHEPPIVQSVLPPQAANYSAEVPKFSEQYDTAGTSAFYSNEQTYSDEKNSWKQ
eukprot:GHVS01073269.1.p1 GENE.GHVS01073269.1~~GHVS01073269.1.p1  ORF type:complete len:266 (+),score=20.29 GHVS01073269.1:77-799(+)